MSYICPNLLHRLADQGPRRKYDIFHFQSPGRCLPDFSDHLFLPVLVGCLNSLHSCGAAGRGDVVSPSAQGVLKRLEIGAWFTYTCIQRGLDYAGEEVRLAQPIS